MDLKKFHSLRENYKRLIEEAFGSEKASKQSQSVWFDRKTIEKLLEQTKEEEGGLKIFFGVYDENTISEIKDSGYPTENIGKLTVILSASNNNEDPTEESRIINGGKVCPPDC